MTQIDFPYMAPSSQNIYTEVFNNIPVETLVIEQVDAFYRLMLSQAFKNTTKAKSIDFTTGQ
jgi:hypothetical protein